MSAHAAWSAPLSIRNLPIRAPKSITTEQHLPNRGPTDTVYVRNYAARHVKGPEYESDDRR